VDDVERPVEEFVARNRPTVALLDIKLVATSAGSSPLTLTLTDLSAAETFIDLLPAALIVSGVVRVQ